MATADSKTTTYIKLGSDGNVIEREALTAADHVQFKGTGWVLKDSAAGKRVSAPKKTDDVSRLSASAVTGHAAAASAHADSAAEPQPAAPTGPKKS